LYHKVHRAFNSIYILLAHERFRLPDNVIILRSDNAR
jgi:hypothetical protein